MRRKQQAPTLIRSPPFDVEVLQAAPFRRARGRVSLQWYQQLADFSHRSCSGGQGAGWSSTKPQRQRRAKNQLTLISGSISGSEGGASRFLLIGFLKALLQNWGDLRLSGLLQLRAFAPLSTLQVNCSKATDFNGSGITQRSFSGCTLTYTSTQSASGKHSGLQQALRQVFGLQLEKQALQSPPELQAGEHAGMKILMQIFTLS